MDDDTTPAAAKGEEAPETPCRPVYEWTRDFRIVKACR
jgi:hypothetical protein